MILDNNIISIESINELFISNFSERLLTSELQSVHQLNPKTVRFKNFKYFIDVHTLENKNTEEMLQANIRRYDRFFKYIRNLMENYIL